MRIGYFINQYPKPSHSFIRREILALEARGNVVFRYALKSNSSELVEPSDKAEQAKTKHVFDQAPLAIAGACIATTLAHPYGSLRALVAAFRMGVRSDRGLLRHFAYLAEAAVITNWCRGDHVQHLHAHFGTNSAAVALLVHKFNGLPYSFTVHGPDEFDRPEFISLGRKIRNAAFVVAVSSFGRSQLMRWVEPDHWPKIKVVHCGLDAEFQTAASRPAGTAGPRLLCIGRLDKQKGHTLLIDAARRLRDQGLPFELVLAGDGPLRDTIDQQITALGLGDHVRITGWISGAEIRSELELARALISPSFAEGLPVVIMEAMAMQRPVIATHIAGIPELVISEETGWLIPAGDEVALLEAMRAVLSASQQQLDSMGEKGRRRVLDRHDVNQEAAKLEAFFRASIDEARPC